MCTATWFHGPQGLELYFNRDERRSRAPAEPPAVRTRGTLRFIAPLDGDFGGSWIAVSQRGLVLCLLNGYAGADPPRPPDGFESRGFLVTTLIDAPTADEVERGLRLRPLVRYRSFALAVFDDRGPARLARWSAGRLSVERELTGAEPLVSSSFDSQAVRESRVALFRDMLGDWRGPREALHLRYHASHLPRRGAYSPCMHRPDATTVSFSRIVVGASRIAFHYTPGAPGDDPAASGPPLCLARG